MASIRRRDVGRDVKWQVRWREAGAAQYETFATETEAIRFRGQVDAADQRWPENWMPGAGPMMAPLGDDPTLAEWFVRSVASRSKANPRTRADYSRDFNRHVPPWLASLPIGAITREHVGLWHIGLQGVNVASSRWKKQRKLSPKTIHNLHNMVSSVMKDAQADDLIKRNPFLGQSKSIPIRLKKMCFLSPEEYVQFREFIADYYRPFADFLFTTGLRFGEATALLPEHFDLAGQQLHVTTAWKKEPDGTYVSETPKTDNAFRTLDLTRKQVDDVKNLFDGNLLVFRNRRDDRIQQSTFHGDTWQPALARAAEAGFTKRPRPHDLRHSHAAYLLSISQPLLAVSLRLGHASIATTNDRYGHLLPHVGRDMISAMEAVGY